MDKCSNTIPRVISEPDGLMMEQEEARKMDTTTTGTTTGGNSVPQSAMAVANEDANMITEEEEEEEMDTKNNNNTNTNNNSNSNMDMDIDIDIDIAVDAGVASDVSSTYSTLSDASAANNDDESNSIKSPVSTNANNNEKNSDAANANHHRRGGGGGAAAAARNATAARATGEDHEDSSHPGGSLPEFVVGVSQQRTQSQQQQEERQDEQRETQEAVTAPKYVERDLQTIEDSVPSRSQKTINSNNQDNDNSTIESQRAPSQSSNWGFFDDMDDHKQGGGTPSPSSSSSSLLSRNRRQHGGGENPSLQRKRGSSRGGGLVPQQQMSDSSMPMVQANKGNDAAMGVTAPPYVLEESLSSQKLWKQSAGKRPPQPIDERLFYEHIWAHNFEKSKVNYQMPVDVLTATSPVSLSAWAESNFETGGTSGNAALSNYNLGGKHRGHSGDPSDGKTKTRIGQNALAVAEQALEAQGPTRIPTEHKVVNKVIKGTGSDGDLTVLVRGDNVFGTTVSKSFAQYGEKNGTLLGVDTVNIGIASYRVVESKKRGKYAQFLVIYREGSIRDTIGVWKRQRDFEELAKTVTQSHEGCAVTIANMSPLSVTEEPEIEHLPNAITSWRLLKKRQRWYRCLDAGYLSLKVFLLERFLHDILFESSSPKLLREFCRR